MLPLPPEAQARYDETTEAMRSCFLCPSPNDNYEEFSNPLTIADAFLADHSDWFHLDGIDLEMVEQADGSAQTTCRYAHYHNQIPVYGSYIHVTLRKTDRQVVSAVNTLDYSIPSDVGAHTAPLTAEDALKKMYDALPGSRQGLKHSVPKLFIRHQRLVWRIATDTLEPKAYLEWFIDAMDGEIVDKLDRRRFYVSREAKVFWPDPVTSSMNTELNWGSSALLLDLEQEVTTLENLDDPKRGGYTLQGKWVRIVDKEDPKMRGPVTETQFLYASKDRRFLSVMAYYYIDRLVEWLQSLDVPAFNQAFKDPIEVDAQGADQEDNSHFVAQVDGSMYIAFGEGGTPDASDPGVIVHEFGHALHYLLLGQFLEPSSCEEGFNDFLSCVFRDRFNVHGFDRANPFPWDNHADYCWDPNRRCDCKLRFDDPKYASLGLYAKGTIYATALWNIYLTMGGQSQQPDERLAAAAEIIGAYMDTLIATGANGPVIDLAQGLINSDQNRTGGRYSEGIRDAFRQQGLWK